MFQMERTEFGREAGVQRTKPMRLRNDKLLIQNAARIAGQVLEAKFEILTVEKQDWVYERVLVSRSLLYVPNERSDSESLQQNIGSLHRDRSGHPQARVYRAMIRISPRCPERADERAGRLRR